jgi:hypothetical protein
MPYNNSQMYDPNMNMGFNQADPNNDPRQMADPFMMNFGPMGFGGFNQMGFGPMGFGGFNQMGFGDFDDFNNPFIHHHFHHHFFHFPIGFGFFPFRRF